MSRRKTTEEVIEEFKKVHGNRYGYGLVEYVNNRDKVKIICHEHGVFEQNFDSHKKGHGCVKCSIDEVSKRYMMSKEDFIKKSKLVHGDKYKYDKVDYKGNKIKVIISCNVHGDFAQIPSKHMSGQGCKLCSNLAKGDRKRYSKEWFIEKSEKVHGDRYDYSLVNYKGSFSKVKIICKLHKVFEQTPNSHLCGHGCSECAKNLKLTTKDFVDKSIKIHGNIYDYSETEYINNKSNVKVICNIHGDFILLPGSHLNGYGCPYCSDRMFDSKSFITKSKEIHGKKYDYSLVDYKNNTTNVKIICPIHDVFEQAPSNHCSGKGCPKCGIDSKAKSARSNPTGWNVTNWELSAKRSKRFDSFKVYIIKCWNDNEVFYKVGRTFLTVKERFSSKLDMPYNYEIIKEIIFETAKKAFDYENIIKRENKIQKYLPKNKFNGRYECFKTVSI